MISQARLIIICGVNPTYDREKYVTKNKMFSHPFRENSFSIIKILEQQNSFSFNSIFSKDCIVSGDSEFKVIHHASSSEISLSSISCLILEEPNNRNRFALGVSLGIIQRGQSLGRGASLLLQPRYNGVGSSD